MPRKTLQQRKRSCITLLVKNLLGTENANDIMNKLKTILPETVGPPKAGKFYIFVYNAKTSGVRYDQNPLVAVTEVFNWGFRGINYHWGEVRQYTWDEVAGAVYEVYREEIDDLRRLPFSNILTK